jgi:acyl-coenzyme A synthetase/AMP-(fatty) acid ligase/aryl carrier-like protein
MVEHANVARLFTATKDWFHFDSADVWTFFHSFAFDFSVWEIWGALLHGGRLILVPALCARTPEDFYALLCREGVTVLNQTPSAFRQLMVAQGEAEGKPHRLRYIIFGGEALDARMLAPWIERTSLERTSLVNMYGITEITVHGTYRVISEADVLTPRGSLIGKPIPDLRIYVLDAHMEPVPVGVAGELYVAGAGVARGYLNRPELTAERFITDRFSDDPNARLYKTGDLGRWRSDGSIEYLGRNDSQVKVRGYRVELGEIEAKLSECEGVGEAVVIAREDDLGAKRLVAYVVARQAAELSVLELRSHLASLLPDYMVPSAFVLLESLPLNPNGKLDRQALPVSDHSSLVTQKYEAPLGAMEETIASIWKQLFGLETVGRQDHFFELGGHSFMVITLIERLREQGIVADVRTVFAAPTLAALAATLADKQHRSTAFVVPPNLIPRDFGSPLKRKNEEEFRL